MKKRVWWLFSRPLPYWLQFAGIRGPKPEVRTRMKYLYFLPSTPVWNSMRWRRTVSRVAYKVGFFRAHDDNITMLPEKKISICTRYYPLACWRKWRRGYCRSTWCKMYLFIYTYTRLYNIGIYSVYGMVVTMRGVLVSTNPLEETFAESSISLSVCLSLFFSLSLSVYYTFRIFPLLAYNIRSMAFYRIKFYTYECVCACV